MLRSAVLCALLAAATAAPLDPAQSAFTCKGPKAYVQPVVNCVHVLGKRQYVAATGPGIAAGAGGGYTLSVNGQVGSVWPQNISVTLSGALPFVGAVLTSFQFTNRAGANVWTSTDVATSYHCASQVGNLQSVAAGTASDTIAYWGAPIRSLTTTFLLNSFPEATTLKWFVQPAATTPAVWYGPFPQVVSVSSTPAPSG